MEQLLLAVTLLASNAGTREPLDLLVERYLEGQRNEAVTSLGALDQGEARAQAKELITKLAPDVIRDEPRAMPLFKAAVMLFTDRAVLDHGEGQIDLYWRHLNIAVALVNEVSFQCGRPPAFRATAYSVRSCTSCLSFAHRWYLLAGLMTFRIGEPSRTVFESGLKQFPSDPRLLLARGTLDETLGAARLYEPPLGSQGTHSAADQYGRHSASDEHMEAVAARAQHLAEAAAYFRKALVAEPQVFEARLRLGRVLFLQGHEADALAELEAVEHGAPQPATRYLAALFQGRLHEGKRRFAQAAKAYGRAASYLGDTPTAQVALAHALDLAGDKARAADALEHALPPPGGEALNDPWWTYLMGQSHEAEPLHDELQAEVTP